jgi:hypothetical protein
LKREKGTVRLMARDYKQVVEGIAALWQERRAANAGDVAYSLMRGRSVPPFGSLSAGRARSDPTSRFSRRAIRLVIPMIWP